MKSFLFKRSKFSNDWKIACGSFVLTLIASPHFAKLGWERLLLQSERSCNEAVFLLPPAVHAFLLKLELLGNGAFYFFWLMGVVLASVAFGLANQGSRGHSGQGWLWVAALLVAGIIVGLLSLAPVYLFLLALASIAARLFYSSPLLSGLLLGPAPSFQLSFVLLWIPFSVAVHKKPKLDRQQWWCGLFLGMFCWLIVIPSLILGPEQAFLASRLWLECPRLPLVWSALYWAGKLILLAGGVFVGFFLLERTLPKMAQTRASLGWFIPWLLIALLLDLRIFGFQF